MFITVKGMTNLNLKQTWPKLGENKKILTTQWLVCVLLIPWWAICCTIILNLLPFLFQCVVANVSFLSLLLSFYLSLCLSVCLSLSQVFSWRSVGGALRQCRWAYGRQVFMSDIALSKSNMMFVTQDGEGFSGQWLGEYKRITDKKGSSKF